MGLIYEPRSFWSILSVTPPAQGGDPAGLVATFDREHFRNGTRHPIVLKRFALAAIGYALRGNDNAAAPNALNYRNSAAIINECFLHISVPGRQEYSRERLRLSTWTPLPTGEPPGPPGTAFSGPWGVCVMDFDHPLVLPQNGNLELDFTGVIVPGAVFNPGDQIQPALSIAVKEQGGLFAGDSRIVVRQLIQATRGQTPFDPEGAVPPFDAFGVDPNPPSFANGIQGIWAPQTRFSARAFNQQNPNRGGAASLLGVRAHIDQIDWDTTFVANLGGANLLAPLSMKMGTRIRTVDSGTKMWWWRPGAPMCLVFDKMTPAQVYELPLPITLGPGDTIELELQIPDGALVGSPPAFVRPVTNIGVSFNGFAAIEG
ncbi:MAG: hypothetical protein JSV86_05415 [Gemmatimonadota bacterium]|nr:MAG: hypothetical protein JSV86_05415 [Gemmatimonadota bacterium]